MRDNNPTWLGEPTGVEVPFTLPVQEVPRELWLPPRPARLAAPKPFKHPRPLGFAMPMVILIGLLSAFFSWVSAEPLWIALGHHQTGTATVTKCVGDGITRRCKGNLQSVQVSLLGLGDKAAPGQTVKVQTVSERSQRAYAGGGFVLRWLPGLVLVLLCGLAIALVTGVTRLPSKRERWAAFGVSLAAPVLVTIGFLAAAF